MENEVHGLLIDNKIYPITALPALCDSFILNENVPDWERNVYSFIKQWMDEKDYIIQPTSGTTGKPKELRLSKKSMILSAHNTIEYFDLKFGETALLCLPVEYIAGKMMVVRALIGGLNLLLTKPNSLPDISELGKIDFCAMVPLQVYNSLNSVETLRKVKKLIIGGADIRDELEVILRDLPNEVYATYGMAETCAHVAVRRLSGQAHERFYKAIPGVIFFVDSRNCLTIRADYLDEDIVTNDVVDLIDEHSFRWIGRFDNVINSGGIKIVPEEVEAIISKATGLDCSIVGLPDAQLGQRMVLVLEKGGSEISLDEMEASLRDELPAHLCPKEIIFIDDLPRNHSFKVNRQELIDKLLFK